jgi:hypothetical protein
MASLNTLHLFASTSVKYAAAIWSVAALKGKGKGFPLQAWVGSWGSGRLSFRIFSTFGTMKVERSSPLRTGRLHPQKFPSTHF